MAVPPLNEPCHSFCRECWTPNREEEAVCCPLGPAKSRWTRIRRTLIEDQSLKNWWSQGESNHAHKRFEIARSTTLLSALTPPLTPPPGRLRLAYPATTTARAASARPQPRLRESRRPWLRLRSRPPALGRSQAARARELAHVSRAGRVGPGPSRTSSRDEVFAFSDSHGGGGGSDTIAAGASPRRSRRATGRIRDPAPCGS